MRAVISTSNDNQLSEDRHLVSSRNTARIEEPFTIFTCENFFPEDFYRQLVAQFPSDALRAKMRPTDFKSRIDQEADSQEFARLLANSPAWSQVFNLFTSRKVVRDLYSEFGSIFVLRSRPSIRRIRRLLQFVLLPRVTVKFDFVMSRGGYHLTPHTDGTKKLIAMMIYLPSAGRNSSSDEMATLFWTEGELLKGGFREVGTNLFTSRSFPRVLEESDRLNDECDGLKVFQSTTKLVTATKFSDNVIAGFVKSHNSWHSVNLSGLPYESERCTVLVNLNIAGPPKVIRYLLRRVKRLLQTRTHSTSSEASY